MVTPAAERRAHLKEAFGMSERRACKAIGCCRMTVRYESTRPDDRDLRERMKVIAHERRRFGYRRVHILLKRDRYAETSPEFSYGGEPVFCRKIVGHRAKESC
jgi:putative transposase